MRVLLEQKKDFKSFEQEKKNQGKPKRGGVSHFFRIDLLRYIPSAKPVHTSSLSNSWLTRTERFRLLVSLVRSWLLSPILSDFATTYLTHAKTTTKPYL